MSKLKEIALDIIRLGRTHDEEATRFLKSNEQRLNENFRRLKEATESIMADYYSRDVMDTLLAGKSNVGHNHDVRYSFDKDVARTPFTPTSGSSYNPYGGCWYQRYGKVCHVHIGMGSLTANTTTTIYTLPSALHPATSIIAIGAGYSTVVTDINRAFIYNNGVLQVLTTSEYAIIDINYLVD